MRAEHRLMGSTGGIAPAYHPRMRTGIFIALNLLLAPIFACSEETTTRPNDGTVQLWDECVWDGQVTRSLCEPELACAWNGICVPRCDAIDECDFDGFQSECGVNNEEKVCRVRCNDAGDCPQTGGAALQCVNFFCVRDP